MRIEISLKFKPLFKLLSKDFQPDIDTVIMTGGRASGKSFTVALFSLIALVVHAWNVLYTRYTNMSIVDSVKPEVTDKIEMLGYGSFVTDTQRQIESKGNRIAFKGIHTGSKIQTANLKSLSGFNCFVVDEAEEVPDYETFKKVFYSIRDTDKRNLTILILNPTTKQHWIYNEFFEKRGIEAGSNTIKGNVMYIHTSYLDVNPKFVAKNIVKDYERLLIESPEKYDNIVLGGWVAQVEGLLLPISTLQFTDFSALQNIHSNWTISVVDPADHGGDNFAGIFLKVVIFEKRLSAYITDVIYSGGGVEANSSRTAERLKINHIEQAFVEVNGLGVAAAININKELGINTKLSPIKSHENKDVRIQSHYEFVQRHFVFKSNYAENPEYKRFVSDLSSYVEGGENNHKKDAIDVCCMAAQIIKVKFAKFLYG